MIRVRVKLFAVARDIVGAGETTLSLPPSSSSADVLNMLVETYPLLSRWKEYLRLAVNCEYVHSNYTLHDNDEVAIIPPVSGG